MDSRFFAPLAIALMLVLGVLTVAGSAFAQSDDRWYIGEGAEQDMYVTYRIQSHETNNGEPYELTIYFQEQDEDGNWIAPAYVVYKGRVFTGTLKLGDNLARLGGGSIIPDEMMPFIGGYDRSLQWLEGFTSKSRPLSLSQPSWGKIGQIGGEEIKPLGKEQVTVPAGTYDATVIGWHKGVDNKIWVVNDFPYPVKAETFLGVSSGRQPVDFAFSLLKTGTGEPVPPEEQPEIPTPPLQQATGRGTYVVNLSWDPEAIKEDTTVEFEVSFYDNNDDPLGRVSYDFVVTDVDGNVVYESENSFTDADEVGFETVEFGGMGPVTITVTINSVSGVDTGVFTETADFDLVVVPEFPASVAVIAAAVIGLVVLLTRFRGTSLGLFGGRNPL